MQCLRTIGEPDSPAGGASYCLVGGPGSEIGMIGGGAGYHLIRPILRLAVTSGLFDCNSYLTPQVAGCETEYKPSLSVAMRNKSEALKH